MPGQNRQIVASTRTTRIARTPVSANTSRRLRSACLMNEIFDKHSNQFTRSTQRKNPRPNRNRRQEQPVPSVEEMNKQVENYFNNVGHYWSVGF